MIRLRSFDLIAAAEANGSARAQAFMDYMAFKHGNPLNDTQEAHDARQHPKFEQMFYEECCKHVQAGALA